MKYFVEFKDKSWYDMVHMLKFYEEKLAN